MFGKEKLEERLVTERDATSEFWTDTSGIACDYIPENRLVAIAKGNKLLNANAQAVILNIYNIPSSEKLIKMVVKKAGEKVPVIATTTYGILPDADNHDRFMEETGISFYCDYDELIKNPEAIQTAVELAQDQ